VFQLGLAATYRPGDRAVRRALDEGVNYLFAFGIDSVTRSSSPLAATTGSCGIRH
jgi:hypothetical protein